MASLSDEMQRLTHKQRNAIGSYVPTTELVNEHNSGPTLMKFSHYTLSLISAMGQFMGNKKHVSVFCKGPDSVDKYMAAKELKSLDLSNEVFEGLSFPSGYGSFGANFENSRFHDCNMSLHLNNTNLRNCVLQGDKLKIHCVGNAILEGAELYDLDLTTTDGLSQRQIDSTSVGVNIKLNEYLMPADHWASPEAKDEQAQLLRPPPSVTPPVSNPNSNKHPGLWPERTMSQSEPNPSEKVRELEAANETTLFPTDSSITKHIKVNNLSVRLTGLSLIDAIDDFLLTVKQSNSLDPDFKEQAKTFLTQHAANLEALLLALPEPEEPITENVVEHTKPALETFLSAAKEGFQALIDPKRLGEAMAPTTVILLSAAVAAQFGVSLEGMAFGAWFSGKESLEEFVGRLFKEPKD